MAKTSVKDRLTKHAGQTKASPKTNGSLNRSTVALEVPVEDLPPDSNQSLMHIDIHLTRAQGNALRRVARGLDAARATLKDGKRAVNRQDAIRWLLEQVT